MPSREVATIEVTHLSVQGFLTDYVARNRPVVVSGSLRSWNLAENWTPSHLESRFGDQIVPVYNNYFDLQTIVPLKQFFADNFGQNTVNANTPPYVRWYTKQFDLDFCWADDPFAKLREHWSPLSFLPTDSYVLPYAPAGRHLTPVTDYFPAKGLFISPRGARTSLHYDPWESCAVLCQLYGAKRCYFYGPEQAKYLQNQFGTVDVTRPDHGRFPLFNMAQLGAVCTLTPGDVMYIPHGWFHQVECESDSVSLTWNFVHRTTISHFVAWLSRGTVSEFDERVLRFFYRLAPGRRVAEEILLRIQDGYTN